MHMRAKIFVHAVIIWLMLGPALAGPLEDGLKAYRQKNFATALRIWRPLAERGDASAQYNLGGMYDKGHGVPQDYAQAMDWYRKAAAQGNASAQINLGGMYAEGQGVPQDYAQAVDWYRKAAAQGDASAQINLGIMYDKGHGVPQDYAQAMDWYRKAAEQDGPYQWIARLFLNHVKDAADKQAAQKAAADKQAAQKAAADKQAAQKADADKQAAQKAAADKAEMAAQIDAAVRREVAALREAAGKEAATAQKEATAPQQTTAEEVSPAAINGAVSNAEDAAASLLAPGVKFGEYHALVIGNSGYRHLPKLPSARKDAEQVSKILRERYGFKVTTLLDASRADILDTLEKLRETLTDEQNLLIYYAGHGDIDKVNQRGNWLPVDARRDSTTNWIKNIDVSDILNRMTAKQIMLVVDSCYSGTLTRTRGRALRAA